MTDTTSSKRFKTEAKGGKTVDRLPGPLIQLALMFSRYMDIARASPVSKGFATQSRILTSGDTLQAAEVKKRVFTMAASDAAPAGDVVASTEAKIRSLREIMHVHAQLKPGDTEFGDPSGVIPDLVTSILERYEYRDRFAIAPRIVSLPIFASRAFVIPAVGVYSATQDYDWSFEKQATRTVLLALYDFSSTKDPRRPGFPVSAFVKRATTIISDRMAGHGHVIMGVVSAMEDADADAVRLGMAEVFRQSSMQLNFTNHELEVLKVGSSPAKGTVRASPSIIAAVRDAFTISSDETAVRLGEAHPHVVYTRRLAEKLDRWARQDREPAAAKKKTTELIQSVLRDVNVGLVFEIDQVEGTNIRKRQVRVERLSFKKAGYIVVEATDTGEEWKLKPDDNDIWRSSGAPFLSIASDVLLRKTAGAGSAAS